MISYLFLKRRFERQLSQMEIRIRELESRCDRLSDVLVTLGTAAGVKHVEKQRGRSEVELWGLSDPPVFLGKEKSHAAVPASTTSARSAASVSDVNHVPFVYIDNDDVPARSCISHSASSSHHSSPAISNHSSSSSHHSSHGSHGGFDHGGGSYDSGSSFDSGGSLGCD
ncbi:hypothetical protein [Cronobacter malonaticus]|uniref:hypothetical protein n=1 Tax=Cronobacter malonaticus TaxID=413503 RepID=UPI00131A01EF|nr:hypothetical protein [Cronobacter malonaticus]